MGHLAELKLTGDSWSTQGTIRQVVPDGAGVTISVADAAGKVAAYHVAAATPVTRDGAAATPGALQPEDSVTLTISGNQVLTLEAQSPSTTGTVQGTVLEVDVQAVREGVVLRDGYQCMPGEMELLPGKHAAYFTIRDGKYHQFKRMMASRGKRVTYLKRIRFGPLELDGQLDKGGWRALTEEEKHSLFRQ